MHIKSTNHFRRCKLSALSTPASTSTPAPMSLARLPSARGVTCRSGHLFWTEESTTFHRVIGLMKFIYHYIETLPQPYQIYPWKGEGRVAATDRHRRDSSVVGGGRGGGSPSPSLKLPKISSVDLGGTPLPSGPEPVRGAGRVPHPCTSPVTVYGYHGIYVLGRTYKESVV
jgi:hypothetical protein